jgi:hypothetical protein
MIQSSALDTITQLIQSPPGQLAAGGVLGGIVWKFFARVEAVLTENTKLEIAVWLLGVKVAPRWQTVIGAYVTAVCGTSALSLRSGVVALVTGTIGFAIACQPLAASFSGVTGHARSMWSSEMAWSEVFLFLTCFCVAFISLLLIDYEVRRMRLGPLELYRLFGVTVVFYFGLLLINYMATLQGSPAGESAPYDSQVVRAAVHNFPFPSTLMAALVSTSWMWLYGTAALLLHFMHRFDIGFDWFNRKFDIEKKPLESIGLISGALVAVLYWSVVIVSRVI